MSSTRRRLNFNSNSNSNTNANSNRNRGMTRVSKYAKKWLNARPHEIRYNKMNIKLPGNARDPISFKNFEKGNDAVMVLKKRVQNGRIRVKRYYLEKNTVEQLAKSKWRTILRMKASARVFSDPINRRAVYRRNLMNVKFLR
jgi:hypothetical protein